MKNKVSLFVLLVASSMMLGGCSKNTPKEVASTWLNGFNHMDFEQSKKVSTNDTKNLLESLEKLTEGISDSGKAEVKKITVSIKDVKEESDKAVVTYSSSDNPHEQTLNLVKQNDKWLVLFTKTDLVGTVAKQEEPTEPEQPATPDTTINNTPK